MSQNHICEGCYFYKLRDVDPDTGRLAWGPWCLKSGQPVRCDVSVLECEGNENPRKEGV